MKNDRKVDIQQTGSDSCNSPVWHGETWHWVSACLWSSYTYSYGDEALVVWGKFAVSCFQCNLEDKQIRLVFPHSWVVFWREKTVIKPEFSTQPLVMYKNPLIQRSTQTNFSNNQTVKPSYLTIRHKNQNFPNNQPDPQSNVCKNQTQNLLRQTHKHSYTATRHTSPLVKQPDK